MRFRNPCKKCLVRPACTNICHARYKYRQTIEVLFESIPSVVIIAMAALCMSLL